MIWGKPALCDDIVQYCDSDKTFFRRDSYIHRFSICWTIQIKMHNWASVNLSNGRKRWSQSAMSFQSCCVKSPAMTSQHRVAVLLDSWRALIKGNISDLFLKPRNNEPAVSTNASDLFLCLMTAWLTQNDASVAALALELSSEKHDCFSHLGYWFLHLSLSQLAFRSEVSVIVFITSPKGLLHVYFHLNNNNRWADQTNALRLGLLFPIWMEVVSFRFSTHFIISHPLL